MSDDPHLESDAEQIGRYFRIWSGILKFSLGWDEYMVRAWSRWHSEAAVPELTGHEPPMHWIAALLIPWDLRRELSLEEYGILRNKIEIALGEGSPPQGPQTDEEFKASCERALAVIKRFRQGPH